MDKDGNIGIEPGTETVYGTHDDNTMVMSEKVGPEIQTKKKIDNANRKKSNSTRNITSLCSQNATENNKKTE